MIGGLANVLGEDVVEESLVVKEFIHLDFGVRRSAAEAARRLVDHDACIGQRETLAMASRRKQNGSHGGRLANAVGADVAGEHLHGVIDGEASGDGASRAVDVQIDVLLRVFALEEEELGDDGVGDAVVDFRAEEDDAVFQQPRIDVIRTFTLGGLFDDVWDVV